MQSDTSNVDAVITGAQVAELGTNGRSVYSLYAMVPGASSIQADLVIPTPVSGDNNVSVDGQRAGHNLQLLDGTENLDRGGSQASVMPSIDAIAEFRSMDSNYSAEYGLAGAATITQVIKSGGKRFHASAWEFVRNDALDARGYFNPSPEHVAELRFNVYGFNLGGQVPLWKEHPTFFFYNQEWRSIVQGGSILQQVPPSSAYPDAGGAGTGAVIPSGSPITVPTATELSATQAARFTAAGLTLGAPFPNNTIPDSLLDANAKALLTAGIFPANNATLSNGTTPAFHGGANAPTTVREELARVDHEFTPKFSVFGHWVQESVSETYSTVTWASNDNVPTVGSVFGNPSYSAVIHTTYQVSPTLLNEAAFNYNGNRINIIPNGLVTAPSGFTFNRLFTGPTPSPAFRRSIWVAQRQLNTARTGRPGRTRRTITSSATTFPGPRARTSSSSASVGRYTRKSRRTSPTRKAISPSTATIPATTLPITCSAMPINIPKMPFSPPATGITFPGLHTFRTTGA